VPIIGRPFAKAGNFILFWGTDMIDWDWQTQLESCQRKIVELEEKIASQRQKLQRLLDRNMNATFAQRILAMRQESLERVQSYKHLIETRIADRAADQLVELRCYDEEPKHQVLDANSRARRG
jgi:hypothetical protein